jgi:hypothetical protein
MTNVPNLFRQTKPNEFSGSTLIGIILPKHVHTYFHECIYELECIEKVIIMLYRKCIQQQVYYTFQYKVISETNECRD